MHYKYIINIYAPHDVKNRRALAEDCPSKE